MKRVHSGSPLGSRWVPNWFRTKGEPNAGTFVEPLLNPKSYDTTAGVVSWISKHLKSDRSTNPPVHWRLFGFFGLTTLNAVLDAFQFMLVVEGTSEVPFKYFGFQGIFARSYLSRYFRDFFDSPESLKALKIKGFWGLTSAED